MKRRIITVFGSGHIEENFPDYQKAVLLGKMLAENDYSVCNGGYGGVMEAVARGAKQAGGKTLGITAGQIRQQPNRWIDKVICEKTWQARLFRLIEKGDAYVVFDGGTGTLTELFMVWEMANKKLHQKTVILYGTPLIRFVQRLKRKKFVLFNPCLKFAQSLHDVLDFLDETFEQDALDS